LRKNIILYKHVYKTTIQLPIIRNVIKIFFDFWSNLQVFLLTRTFGGVAKELITAFATSSASSILKFAVVVTCLAYLIMFANISVAVGPGLTL